MSLRELSSRLKQWRTERPDEWLMDEFIRLASTLEYQNEQAANRIEALEEKLKALREQEPAVYVPKWVLITDDDRASFGMPCVRRRSTVYEVPLYAAPAPAAVPEGYVPVPDSSLILQAISRAWCYPLNERKEMDADIAEAATKEISELLAAAQKEGK